MLETMENTGASSDIQAITQDNERRGYDTLSRRPDWIAL